MTITDRVRARRNTIDDVWKKVDRSGGPDACWPWTGAIGQGGYGQWGMTTDAGYRQGRAHRFAYEAANGPFDPKLVVCHRCDVRVCCNPAHLFLGTQQVNNDDMRAKGRAKEHTHGAEHGTYSGHQRHVMRSGGWTMPPCEPCREAKRAYERSRRTSPPRHDRTDQRSGADQSGAVVSDGCSGVPSPPLGPETSVGR